jgi:hypothetical protein
MRHKLLDHLDDPHKIFKHDLPADFQCVTITTSLLDWEQKEAVFKLPIA